MQDERFSVEWEMFTQVAASASKWWDNACSTLGQVCEAFVSCGAEDLDGVLPNWRPHCDPWNDAQVRCLLVDNPNISKIAPLHDPLNLLIMQVATANRPHVPISVPYFRSVWQFSPGCSGCAGQDHLARSSLGVRGTVRI